MIQHLIVAVLCIIRCYNGEWVTGDDSKIVGGYYVEDISTVPWIVSVRRYFEGSGLSHDCGGSIFTLMYVLTACHCLQGEPEDYQFAAGVLDSRDDENAQLRDARRIYLHPECLDLDDEKTYDVAIAQVKRPFKVTKQVKPMRLLSEDPEEFESKMAKIIRSSTRGKGCFVAGWGVETSDGDTSSRYLKGVRLYPISPNECRKAYGKKKAKFKRFDFVKHHQMCAVSKFKNESDCIGDSGGPVVCQGFTVAIVSYGFECGTASPSVFATLPYFLEWFQDEINDDDLRKAKPAARSSLSRSAIHDICLVVAVVHSLATFCRFYSHSLN